MKLTKKQYTLLYNMFHASIEAAAKSGIPIGQEYYNDIDEIQTKLMEKNMLDKL